MNSIWSWNANISDWEASQGSKAGTTRPDMSVLTAPNPPSQAYPYWIRQAYQWSQYQNATYASPETKDPGMFMDLPVNGGPAVVVLKPPPNLADLPPQVCQLVGNMTSSYPYSSPTDNQQNIHWYGDATLIKQVGGAVDKCKSISYGNYVNWNRQDANNQYWVFTKENNVNADLVYEICSCTSLATCQRGTKPIPCQ
jgi:hypothetical protein